MKAGRYIHDGKVRPFLVLPSGELVDWRTVATDWAPPQVRKVVGQALDSGTDADFLAALPILEEYLAGEGNEVSAAGGDILGGGRLAPPLIPRNFLCIGLNYLDHARESKMELPVRPLLFAKTANAISGHGFSIATPKGAEQLDFEAELAVVIGRRCSRVGATEALKYVAGYTCANDISARDFQFADGQWYRGKSCDGFGPLGPWLVTASEIPDARNLRISCRVNGATMQDSTTSNLIFGVPELVEFISSYITLEAGDVIATGTPPGVGFARKPPVYLRPGDVVEVEIERIGILRNTIQA